MRIVILLFSVLLICPMSNYAQSSDDCPDNTDHPKNDSEETLEFFLTSDDLEADRIDKNLNSLDPNTLELLTSSSNSCFNLNNFKSQYLVSSPNVGYTYYKVSNYYFIVSWHSINNTGYKNIYVFDSQYNIHSIWPI